MFTFFKKIIKPNYSFRVIFLSKGDIYGYFVGNTGSELFSDYRNNCIKNEKYKFLSTSTIGHRCVEL